MTQLLRLDFSEDHMLVHKYEGRKHISSSYINKSEINSEIFDVLEEYRTEKE